MEVTAAHLKPGDLVILKGDDVEVAAVTPNPNPQAYGRVVHVDMTDGRSYTWKSGTWLTVALRGGVDVTHVRGVS